jgi:hypothetical protein
MTMNGPKLYGIEPDYQLRGTRVAIVGNSPKLIGRGLGPQIDAHDEVMRFNGALTQDFAPDVGTRTTICCVAIDIAYIFALPFKQPAQMGDGDNELTRDLARKHNAARFLEQFPDATFFLFRPEPSRSWMIAGKHLPEAIAEAGTSHNVHFYDVSPPVILDSAQLCNQRLEALGISTRMRFGGPRTGFKMVLRMLLSGIKPTLYGFDVDPTLATARHYYDNVVSEDLDVYKDHDIRSERDAIAEMARAGLVELVN